MQSMTGFLIKYRPLGADSSLQHDSPETEPVPDSEIQHIALAESDHLIDQNVDSNRRLFCLVRGGCNSSKFLAKLHKGVPSVHTDKKAKEGPLDKRFE